jgi:hypothetical protein
VATGGKISKSPIWGKRNFRRTVSRKKISITKLNPPIKTQGNTWPKELKTHFTAQLEIFCCVEIKCGYWLTKNEGYKIKTVEFDYLSRRKVTRQFKVIKNTA